MIKSPDSTGNSEEFDADRYPIDASSRQPRVEMSFDEAGELVLGFCIVDNAHKSEIYPFPHNIHEGQGRYAYLQGIQHTLLDRWAKSVTHEVSPSPSPNVRQQIETMYSEALAKLKSALEDFAGGIQPQAWEAMT